MTTDWQLQIFALIELGSAPGWFKERKQLVELRKERVPIPFCVFLVWSAFARLAATITCRFGKRAERGRKRLQGHWARSVDSPLKVFRRTTFHAERKHTEGRSGARLAASFRRSMSPTMWR